MMQYKSRKSKCLFITALLLSLVFVQPLVSQNQTKPSKKELENKKKRINDEINQINSLLKATKASKKNSLGALININVKLEKRQELINTINAEIRALNREINQNEAESKQLKLNLEKLKREYARMIVFAQHNQDSYSTLMFVFAAADFNQAYSRLKYMQQYTEFRKKQAAEIIETQSLLLAKLNELRDQRLEKSILLGTEKVEKKNLDEEKTEQEEVLTVLKKKEKELKASLEKKKEDAIQLQLAIKRVIDAEIKRKAEEAAEAMAAAKKAKAESVKAEKKKKGNEKTIPDKKEESDVADKSNTEKKALVPDLNEEAVALSAEFSSNRGKLPWPVTKGVICETYGEHEHPAIKGFMMFNNGVEICASKGMQARAVFEGEVTGIAVSPTGGKLVIIRHGEYLSVYSNLDDVAVKTGQRVALKQAIGTVMYNEDEDKTSMNLQIWKGQKTMDPGYWLLNGR